MTQAQIERAEQRAKALGEAQRDETKLDAMLGDIFQSDGTSEAFVAMDGVLTGEDAEAELSVKDITAGMMNTPTNSGEPLSGTTMDAMIATTANVAEKGVTMDGVNSVAGSGILASFTAMHQYIIKNSQIGGLVGHISELSTEKAGNALKATVFSLIPHVTKGMGGLEDGDTLTPLNFTKPMILSKRMGVLVVEDGVPDYTFNVKAKDSDTGNFAVEHGVTSVILGDTGLELDDYESKPQETAPVREITVNGNQVKMTVNKAAGTVSVIVPAGTFNAGTKLIVETAVSSKEKSKIRGSLGFEIQEHKYMATTTTGSAKIDVLDSRTVQKQLAFGLLAGGLSLVAQKKIAEIQGFALSMASKFASTVGTPINLDTSVGLATTAEAYKKLPTAIDVASVSILEESQITDNVIVVGGTGSVEAYNMLAKNTDGLNVRDTNNANGIKFLGFLDAKYKTFYNPTHDTENPLVDETGAVNSDATKNVYHTLYVYGTPAQPDRSLVLYSSPLPSLPVDFKIDKDSAKEVALEGKDILSVNKDPQVRKMARKILFKMS